MDGDGNGVGHGHGDGINVGLRFYYLHTAFMAPHLAMRTFRRPFNSQLIWDLASALRPVN